MKRGGLERDHLLKSPATISEPFEGKKGVCRLYGIYYRRVLGNYSLGVNKLTRKGKPLVLP